MDIYILDTDYNNFTLAYSCKNIGNDTKQSKFSIFVTSLGHKCVFISDLDLYAHSECV